MSDDTDAFRVLYDANHLRVERLLARIVGPQEAQDLAQAVFAKAATALPSFRGDAQSSTWLYRIAVNEASDWLRSRSSNEAKVTTELPKSCDEVTAESPQMSPEQELIRKEMSECIRGVIGQLPENDRTMLLLGELGGLEDDEIAEVLGINQGAAKVRLHRARQRLKQALTGRCDFYRNEDNEFACEPKPSTCGPASRPSASSRAAKSDG